MKKRINQFFNYTFKPRYVFVWIYVVYLLILNYPLVCPISVTLDNPCLWLDYFRAFPSSYIWHDLSVHLYTQGVDKFKIFMWILILLQALFLLVIGFFAERLIKSTAKK